MSNSQTFLDFFWAALDDVEAADRERVGAAVGAFEGKVLLLDLAGNLPMPFAPAGILGNGMELEPAEAKLGCLKYPKPPSLSVSVSVSVSS